MYYVKTFSGGGAHYDPRRRTYAEYQCDVCNHIECFDITTNSTFNYTKSRSCPKCGSHGKEDYKKNIQSQIEKIITDIEQAQRKKEELEKELQNL